MDVLCIDTDLETATAIEDAGHVVARGDLGYRSGFQKLTHPPHEYDLLICDLRQPACFDVTYWGPGKNDNFQCKIENEIEDVMVPAGDGRTRPKFEIIHTQHILQFVKGKTFGPSDVFRAVETAGIPFILFLNREWLRHVGYRSPNFCNVNWSFNRTMARKVLISPGMDDFLNLLHLNFDLALPLEFTIEKTFHSTSVPSPRKFETRALVTNTVSEVFGEVVILGEGAIWAIPELKDNTNFCISLLAKFDEFLDFQSSVRTGISKDQQETPREVPSVRDVFISHASEDKAEIAKPLAEALKSKGLSVWFDEYELKLGDSLRQKIEDGLRNSRYGLVILSHHFFQKNWPQRELSALVALEQKSKKILPVWHKLSEEDVRQYSPLLVDRFATSTERGIDFVADEVVRAITVPEQSNSAQAEGPG